MVVCRRRFAFGWFVDSSFVYLKVLMLVVMMKRVGLMSLVVVFPVNVRHLLVVDHLEYRYF